MKTVLDHTKAHQKYFEEMTKIPHGSYQEKAYADYLEEFAKQHGLRYIRDELHNVIIYKEASQGYADHPSVILQAHTDMVCEKNKDVVFDFEKDQLQLRIQDGYLYANGTTLGADDGVGVSYMLAILSDDTLSHPALECVFTVQEEVGLFGAMALKKEYFQSKRMINLDDEGEISTCTTSAGGVNVLLSRKVVSSSCEKQGYRLSIRGLQGGHSGAAIHLERGNANKLLVRVLYAIYEQYGLQFVSFDGGIKDNAIPREADAIFVCDASKEQIDVIVSSFEKMLKEELAFSDRNVSLMLESTSVSYVVSQEDSDKIMQLLLVLPTGMRHRSMHIEGLTMASSNMAIVSLNDEEIYVNCSVRGGMESYVDMQANEIVVLAKAFGFVSKLEARYPAWSFVKDSELRNIMQSVCQDVMHQELGLMAMHGGLECGVFKALIPDLDIVTLGPKMYDIHTPNEHLDLASFDRTFTFLVQFLKCL